MAPMMGVLNRTTRVRPVLATSSPVSRKPSPPRLLFALGNAEQQCMSELLRARYAAPTLTTVLLDVVTRTRGWMVIVFPFAWRTTSPLWVLELCATVWRP